MPGRDVSALEDISIMSVQTAIRSCSVDINGSTGASVLSRCRESRALGFLGDDDKSPRGIGSDNKGVFCAVENSMGEREREVERELCVEWDAGGTM